MVALILGMLVCVGLALAVVALVAIPARREGRDLLTPKGEEVMAMARERTQDALDKTGEVISATKDKVTESVTSAGPDREVAPTTQPATTPATAPTATPATAPTTTPAAATAGGVEDTTARRAS